MNREQEAAPPGQDEHYRHILESLPNLAWHVDAEGECDWLNRAWYAFTGRTPADELGQGWARGLHPDDRPGCLAKYRQAFSSRQTLQMEFRLRHRDGGFRWMSSHAGPVFDGRGEFTGYIGVTYDIDERRRLKLGLIRKQAFLDAVLESVDSLIVASDPDGRLSAFNRASREFFGEQDADTPLAAWAARQSFVDLESQTPLPIERLPLYRALAGEKVVGEEIGLIARDGRRRLQATAQPLFGADGQALGAVLVARDITDQWAAETRLRSDNARQRAIAAILSLSLAPLPLRTKLERSLAALLQDDCMGVNSGARISLRLTLKHEDMEVEASTAEAPDTVGCLCHYPIHLEEGQIGLLDFRSSTSCQATLPDFLHTVCAVLAAMVQRHRWEEKITQFSRVIEQSNAGILIADASGVILYVNPALCRITGYSQDQVIDSKPSLFASGHTPTAVYDELWATILAGRDWQGELQNRRRDGTLLWLLVNISPIRDKEGNIVNFLAISEDLTAAKQAEAERQELEQRLAQAEKMEAIGHLAGGIAHDFNNILVAILGFNELAQRQLRPKDTLLASHLEQSLRAGMRAKRLVAQLLTFSRTRTGDTEPIAPGPVVEEVVELMRSTLPATFSIDLSLPPGLPDVRIDPVQLHQVLMNLCINARDATRARGKLRISLDWRPEAHDLACASCRHGFSGNFLAITVEDDGRGMTPEECRRIFEPFYTTKEPGRGTGMGLALVHGIVHFHGGHLTLRTTETRGAEFVVYLPVADARPQVPPAFPARRVAPASGRVLVLDNEEAVAEFIRQALEALGCQVQTRTDSLAAWELFSQDPQAFDLVITDQTMPRLTGSELASRMLARRPDLPIILCTGYSSEIDEASARALGIRRYLMKPMSMTELQRAATDLLAKRGNVPWPPPG